MKAIDSVVQLLEESPSPNCGALTFLRFQQTHLFPAIEELKRLSSLMLAMDEIQILFEQTLLYLAGLLLAVQSDLIQYSDETVMQIKLLFKVAQKLDDLQRREAIADITQPKTEKSPS